MDVFLDFQNIGNVTITLFAISQVNAKTQTDAHSSWVAQTEATTRNLNKKFVFNLRLLWLHFINIQRREEKGEKLGRQKKTQQELPGNCKII